MTKETDEEIKIDAIDTSVLDGGEASEESEVEASFTDDDMASVQQDLELDEKYVGWTSGVRNAVERDLSEGSIGASDFLISKLGGKEGLRERKKRHKKMGYLGSGVGIVGPLILSGGATGLKEVGKFGGKGLVKGLAKKGVQKAAKYSAPVQLGKLSHKTEMLTSKLLNKYMAETGKNKFAKEVLKKGIAKGAGSMVEGTFYNIGHLVSESSLGNEEFNAENVLAYGGEGALWGGLLGGAFGAAPALYKGAEEVIVPVIRNNKVVDFTTKRIGKFKEKFANPENNACRLTGIADDSIDDMIVSQPEVSQNLPKVLKDILRKTKMKAFASKNALHKAGKEYLEEAGIRIGKSLDDLDTVIDPANLPTKSNMAIRIQEGLDDLAVELKLVDDVGDVIRDKTARSRFNVIEENKKFWDDLLLDDTNFTAKQIQDLKLQHQKQANWARKENLPISEEISRNISNSIRGELLEVAKVAGPEGAALRKSLLDYQTTSTFLKHFTDKMKKKESWWLDAKDWFIGSIVSDLIGMGGPFVTGLALKTFAKSDLKNKIRILTGVEKANQTIKKQSNKAVSSFFKKEYQRIAPPLGAKFLIDNPLARDYDNKKPLSESDAMANIGKTLDKMKEDPMSISAYTQNTYFELAAPKTFMAAKGIMDRALMFLDSKMPRAASLMNPLFQKKPKYSSQEIYKYKQYLKAIQNPMSVLHDLKQGVLSREGIEAVKFVYPDFYSRLQLETFNHLQGEPAVDYRQKLQLGILLDMPTEMALQPEMIKGLQQLYKEAQVSQAGGTITAAAANKLDLSESQASEVEQVSNRNDLK